MAVAGVVVTFAKQAQGAERSLVEAKAVSQRTFKRVARLLFAGSVGNQPFKAGSAELAKGELVGRLWPDEFRAAQSQAHGGCVLLGWGTPKSVP